jgi:hypothetical protein
MPDIAFLSIVATPQVHAQQVTVDVLVEKSSLFFLFD